MLNQPIKPPLEPAQVAGIKKRRTQRTANSKMTTFLTIFMCEQRVQN